MFAKIVSRPTMCSDDGRALCLEWNVYTAKHRDQKLWDNAVPFGTEQAARDYCAKKGAKVVGVSWT